MMLSRYTLALVEVSDSKNDRKRQNLNFLKANWLQKTMQEKEDLVRSLDGAIVNLEKEKKMLTRFSCQQFVLIMFVRS